MSYLPNNRSFSSHAIHVGSEPHKWKTSDIMPHICPATTYEQVTPPDHKGLMYTRLENPTRSCLEECLAKLEETEHCLTFPSGMAAASMAKTLLKKGDHVIAQSDLYHGVFNMFKDLNERTDEIEVTFCDLSTLENLDDALQSNTAMVWMESPTNPLMKLVDLQDSVVRIRDNNPSTIVVVDNTFMSPYFQRPINFGVDIVMHSCSKYIGGHSDVLMGALCTNNEILYKQLKANQILLGPVPSPFDCYLAIRSLKTLEVRMQRHMSNALELAKFLENHPMIERVFHPGLPSHPQHEVSLKQCYGHSGMFSIYVKEHKLETTRKILQKLKLIKVADSLGGTETTVKLPTHMPPNALTEEEMEAQGITEGLLRISVGLENPDDLVEDFRQALNIS